MDEHLPLLTAKLSIMVAVSLHCLWSSLQQSKLDKLPRLPSTQRDSENKRPARYNDQQVGYNDWRDNHCCDEKGEQYNRDGGWH